MRAIAVSLICIMLSGCASTPDAVQSVAQSRPITKVKSQDVDIPALLAKAGIHYKDREYTESYDLYGAALMFNPELSEARLGLGDAALALGKPDAAFKAFDGLTVGALSDTQKIRLLAGLALLGANGAQSGDTENHLKHVLQFAPGDARLWNALGVHYDKNEKWVESTEAYVNALKAGTARASTVNNLGMSLMMQGRLDAAMEKFEQALQIAPDTELFDNNRRLVMALRGDYEDAVRGLDDRRAAILSNDAGYIAMQRGDKGLARQLLKRSIAINPVYNPKTQANLDAL